MDKVQLRVFIGNPVSQFDAEVTCSTVVAEEGLLGIRMFKSFGREGCEHGLIVYGYKFRPAGLVSR